MKNILLLVFTFLVFNAAFSQCTICYDDSSGEYGCIAENNPSLNADSLCKAKFGVSFSLDTVASADCSSFANCSGSLPVELTYFKIHQTGKSVVLKWQTASEKNNNYFVVQKSLDGLSFENVGFVGGAGASSRIIDYGFSDFVENGIVYYRLKQVDFDGTYVFSDVLVSDYVEGVPIDFMENPSSVNSLQNYIDKLKDIRPNSIVEIYNLQCTKIGINEVKGIVIVCIFDEKGKVFLSKKIVIK